VYQQQKVKHQQHAKSTVNVEVKTKFLLCNQQRLIREWRYFTTHL